MISRSFHPHCTISLWAFLAGALSLVAAGIPEATSGFQLPVPDIGGGFVFGEDSRDTVPQPYKCWVYHPGSDLNPAHGDEDLGFSVLAAANGKVIVADKSQGQMWGRLVIQHLYKGETFYTQYGHVTGSTILVSAGDDVAKGQEIAKIGKEGTTSAHLHFEVRTATHPAPADAAYWQNCTKPGDLRYHVFQDINNINNWYRDAKTFIPEHGAYSANQPPTSGFSMSAQGHQVTDGQTLILSVTPGAAQVVDFDGLPPRSSDPDPDGTISTYEWSSNGTRIPNAGFTGGVMQFGFGVGTHHISLIVRDNKNEPSTAAEGTIIVSEQSPPPTSNGMWTQKLPALAPPPRENGAMAFDSTRQQVVLFGGWSSSEALGDTWIWDGFNWSAPSVVGPLPRAGHALAYDRLHKEVVLFGIAAFPSDPETWTWDGVNWSQRSPSVTPTSRSYPAMTYDSLNNEIVMFGGGNEGGKSAETWTWDGNNWNQRYPTITPSGREAASMAYDERRHEIVLFGGIDDSGYPTDTWVWDGNSWIQKFPVNNPVGMYGHSLAWDRTIGRIVLAGYGVGGNFETWTWDGSNWHFEDTDIVPSDRFAPSVSSAPNGVMLFGGGASAGNAYLNDTWLWASNVASDIISFSFTGIVTEVIDTSGVLGTSVSVGTPLSGNFSYPATGIDRNQSSLDGRYDFNESASLQLALNTQQGVKQIWVGDPSSCSQCTTVATINGSTADQFDFSVVATSVPDGWDWQLPLLTPVDVWVTISLLDDLAPLTLLGSDALPSTLPLSSARDVFDSLYPGSSFINSVAGDSSTCMNGSQTWLCEYFIRFKLTSLTRK